MLLDHPEHPGRKPADLYIRLYKTLRDLAIDTSIASVFDPTQLANAATKVGHSITLRENAKNEKFGVAGFTSERDDELLDRVVNLDRLALSLASHEVSTKHANTFGNSVLHARAVGRGGAELVTHSDEHGGVEVGGLHERSLAEAEGASEEVASVTLGGLGEPNEL